MILFDPLSKRVDNFEPPASVLVKLILSSFIGSAYLLFNDKFTTRYRIFFLVFYQSLQMFLLCTLFAFTFSDHKSDILSTDPAWGCLGFLAPGHFSNIFLLQGVLSGFAGGFG